MNITMDFIYSNKAVQICIGSVFLAALLVCVLCTCNMCHWVCKNLYRHVFIIIKTNCQTSEAITIVKSYWWQTNVLVYLDLNISEHNARTFHVIILSILFQLSELLWSFSYKKHSTYQRNHSIKVIIFGSVCFFCKDLF